MTSRIITIFIVVLLGNSSISCSPEKKQEKERTRAEIRTDEIFGEGGHFRGNTIGQHIQEVVKADRDFLFKKQEDELNYSIPFSPTDSAHFDVAYFFNQKHLYEIQVDVLINSDQEVKKLFGAFKEKLINRHGNPSEKTDYAYWEVKENGHQLEITLRNESAEYNRPFLSLHIIEPQIFVH